MSNACLLWYLAFDVFVLTICLNDDAFAMVFFPLMYLMYDT